LKKAKKIAIISSHPIQYNAPLFALLAKEPEIELIVFYTWGEQSMGAKFDPDFGKTIDWDIPLLEGYAYTFVQNTSKDPGSHHFKGIINPTLNKEIEHWGADVVWVWGWSFDSHLKAMRYFKGKISVWFRGDSTLLDESKGFSLKKIVRRIFLTWVYRHVDKAYFVGTHNKAYYRKYGLKDTQLVYAPHAIDNDRFSDASGEKTIRALQWRKELGFSDSDFIILFAGKFEKKKNPSFIIELAKKNSSSTIKFLMVGNGILEAELKSETKNDPRFVFLDFQNQSRMPILYRVADIFILPSIGPGESWGLAMNESLASGTRVLGSKFCGGAIDLIKKDYGVHFNPTLDLKHIIKNIPIMIKEKNKLSEKKDFFQIPSYLDIIKSVKNELKKDNIITLI
jgi:glycosyltransferase involved in cell wall biosynthesis